MQTVLVDELTVNVNELFKQYKEGAIFVGFKCNSELVSAFTRDEANKLGLAPGIHCPKNLSHVNIHFNVRK